MLKDMVIEIADAKYFSKLLYKMLFSFNKQNFEILELFIVSLFVYMVYTMFIQNRVEAHNCTEIKSEKLDRYSFAECADLDSSRRRPCP